MKIVINVYLKGGIRHWLIAGSEPNPMKKLQHKIPGFCVAGGYFEKHKIVDCGF